MKKVTAVLMLACALPAWSEYSYASPRKHMDADFQGVSGTEVLRVDYVDQTCMNGCARNCGIECADMPISGKGIRRCAAEGRKCQQQCTRPGDPPPPAGGGNTGGGGGGVTGTLCPAGTVTSQFQGSIYCCPSYAPYYYRGIFGDKCYPWP